MARNDAVLQALLQVAEELGGSLEGGSLTGHFGDRLLIHYVEIAENSIEREWHLRRFASEGHHGEASQDQTAQHTARPHHELVIAVGPVYGYLVERVARDYPDVHFILLDGRIAGLEKSSNITCISFETHEVAFLIGAFAASVGRFTGGGLGFIGSTGLPSIREAQIGFSAGAAFRNPALAEEDAMQVAYIGRDLEAYRDLQAVEATALEMYNRGVRIIFHIVGAAGSVVTHTAFKGGHFVIGSIADQRNLYLRQPTRQSRQLGEAVLTSLVIRFEVVLRHILGGFLEDRAPLTGGYVEYGLRQERAVDVGSLYLESLGARPSGDLVNAAVGIETLRNLILDGSIVVPKDDQELAVWLETQL